MTAAFWTPLTAGLPCSDGP